MLKALEEELKLWAPKGGKKGPRRDKDDVQPLQSASSNKGPRRDKDDAQPLQSASSTKKVGYKDNSSESHNVWRRHYMHVTDKRDCPTLYPKRDTPGQEPGLASRARGQG